MEPQFLAALVVIVSVAIAALSGVKIAKIRAQNRVGEARPEIAGRVQVLEQEVSALRHEMVETQERLDFAERLLAQGPETRRVGPAL